MSHHSHPVGSEIRGRLGHPIIDGDAHINEFYPGFLEAIDKASDSVHLTRMGTTNEQRAIPLAVIGAPGASPQAA